MAQVNHEIEGLQRLLEERSIELRQLDKEMEEQDMDLRTEKEKQRSVLMKLKEISTVDDSFSHACQENIGKIGFVLPTASRLTSQSSSKRAASLANSNRSAGGSGT